MTKVIISKKKRDEVETLLYAGISACVMRVTMEGTVDSGTIYIRDKFIKQIMDILDNK